MSHDGARTRAAHVRGEKRSGSRRHANGESSSREGERVVRL